MSQPPDGERIATLEAEVRNHKNDMEKLIRRIDSMNTKIDGLVNVMAEMSGGKKAVMGLFGLIGGAIGAFATLFGLHLFGKA